MFKNPLKKYQQGGQVSQEQQQMLAAFVEWLPKRVKEFQGMQPEQIVEALNGMTKSPEGQKQVQAYIQQFQQEMQNSKAGMFKDGGKLQDFICKHAKGGKAGCGCKEDGGKVEKHQQNNGKGRGTIAEQDGFSVGKKYWTNNVDGSTQSDQYAVRPNGIAVRQRIVDRSHMLDRDQLPVRDTVNVIGLMQDNGVFAPDYEAEVIYGAHPYFQNNAWSTVRREEDGGVVKGQSGLKEFPLTGTIAANRSDGKFKNPLSTKKSKGAEK